MFLITEKGSLNCRREYENRVREQDMNNALEQFSDESDALFDELSIEFGSNGQLPPSSSVHSFLNTSLSMASLSSLTARSLDESDDYHVHCRRCSEPLFPATDLKFREPSYYSTNVTFQQKVINSAGLCCTNTACGFELGQRIPLRRGGYLFMMHIKSIKFARKGRAGFDTPAKWSNIGFKVKTF